ncbi:DUF1223 domain-containing protein [Azospira sp. APE16]|uniref:DUF1223 domain-containing protein n=1 Tax=Azospira TaxID=146937 RepID=UPI000A018A10|nr:DUF1223 domain-containing protein [Azospira oryzae]
MIELYTSEGCSSCRPAEPWLRDMPQRFDTDKLVALALYVNYWDYIGWQDRIYQMRNLPSVSAS